MENCFNPDFNAINVASSILEASNSDSHEILTIYPDLDTLVAVAKSSKKEKQPVIHALNNEISHHDEQKEFRASPKTKTKLSLRKEASKNLNNCDTRFKCHVCFSTFTEESKYKTHLIEHQQSLYVDCDYCGKKIACNRFVYHVMIHTGEKPHVCSICGRGFRLKKDLRQHSFIHTGEKPYPCDVCGKKFADTSSRRKHFQSHTGEKPHSCDVCHKSFFQISHLREHKVTHTGEKAHTCELCLKKFTTRSSMQRHMLTHDNTCEICNCTFTTNNKLQKHRELHDADRPFSCQVCARRFRKRADLTTHMSTHSDGKSVFCKICGEAFKSYRHLRVHYASYHKDVGPPFRCNICAKGFFQDQFIQRHYAAHLSDCYKRSKCLKCSITFSCNEQLQKHVRLNNCDILYCFECDAQFKCKYELGNHLKTIHNFFADNLIVPDIIEDSKVKRKSARRSSSKKVVEKNLSSFVETSNSSSADSAQKVVKSRDNELRDSCKSKTFHKNKQSPSKVRKISNLPTIVKVEVVSDVSNSSSFLDHDSNSCYSDLYNFND